MTAYRIKLADFEIRALIDILNEHFLMLKRKGKFKNAEMKKRFGFTC